VTACAPGKAPRRQILVVSPIEPSGASWLLNCFLELGIMVGHKPVVDRVWRASRPPPEPDVIWQARDEFTFGLHPKANVLAKFLPALGRQGAFRFRDDLSVRYVQDFPTKNSVESKVILVVRDPRDAFYSMFRRLAPAFRFDEFIAFPNSYTLLDRPAHWSLFIASWLGVAGVHIVRFEDYKKDPEETLRSAVHAVDLHFPDADIATAVARSSFERAREAEQEFRRQFPDDRQVANRSGAVGEGRSHPDVQPLLDVIERSSASVLTRLGYAVETSADGSDWNAARCSAMLLSFFENLRLPPGLADNPVTLTESEPHVLALLTFALRLNGDLVRRAALPPAEARALHDSLAELTRNYCGRLAEHLASARALYADGSAYFFQNLRKTRQVGAMRGPGPRQVAANSPGSPR
jgi:hypothetical protein